MKLHWVRLQLRFEAPKDVKLKMLSRPAALIWQYIAIIATFSRLFLIHESQPAAQSARRGPTHGARADFS